MRLRLILGLAFLALIYRAYCQDGESYLAGDVLHPKNTTNLVLKDVKIVIVPQGNDFAVTTKMLIDNDNKLPMKLECELSLGDGRTYPHKTNILFDQIYLEHNDAVCNYQYSFSEQSRTHLLLFNIDFSVGLNTIIYYQIIKGGTGEAEGFMTYDLANAWKWGNNRFNKIAIEVMGNNGCCIISEDYYVKDFSIVGIGKAINTNNDRIFSIKNGYLETSILPSSINRIIGFSYNSMFFITFSGQGINIGQLLNEEIGKYGKIVFWWKFLLTVEAEISNDTDKEYTRTKILGFEEYAKKEGKENIRLLRNTIYAMHGYVFKDNYLNEYFSNQYWYFPNPNLKYDDLVLDKYEKIIIDTLTKFE